jgi:hypothetical protein
VPLSDPAARSDAAIDVARASEIGKRTVDRDGDDGSERGASESVSLSFAAAPASASSSTLSSDPQRSVIE